MAIALQRVESKSLPSRWLVSALWLAALTIYGGLLWLATDAATVWINDIAWTLASAMAAWSCFHTARRLHKPNARAWWLLGTGCASWLIGQLCWNYYELVRGISIPFPNIGQIFYSSFPLLVIAAVSQLPESRQPPPRLKQFGNIALVMCCLAVTVVLGLLEPARQSGLPTYQLWIAGAHGLVTAATFLYALYALWTYRWDTAWGPMLLLVIGTGIYSVCNLLYAHSRATGTYLPGDLINMSWLVVFGLVAWAASEGLWLERHPYTAAPARLLKRERWIEAVVPAVLLVIMVIVALGSATKVTPQLLWWAAGLFILFAIFLGVREAWIQSDAQHLTDELVDANRRLHVANEELRKSELRYRDLNTALEKRVAERTALLERAYAELEGFSYAVAHDLKGPLRAINSFAHLLREEIGANAGERGEGYLQRIRDGALKMSTLIDDLLSYSHIERRELHATHIDVPSLVQTVVGEFSDELHRCGVQMEVDIPPAKMFVDAEGLSLALRNLIENAIKYSCDAGKPLVRILGTRRDDSMVLAVHDNGIGFDMQYHDQIFKVFQRLHRDDQYPGTGIGLALVRKAAERIGARVWAESRPGEGATFYLELQDVWL
jgi:signal transduction histidine kinase